jgi:hypothetical protein
MGLSARDFRHLPIPGKITAEIEGFLKSIRVERPPVARHW